MANSGSEFNKTSYSVFVSGAYIEFKVNNISARVAPPEFSGSNDRII